MLRFELEEIFKSRNSSALISEFINKNLLLLPKYMQEIDSICAGPLPYHTGSVLNHIKECMERISLVNLTDEEYELAMWMAFSHDFGKLTTPKDLLPHHYGHELRGIELVKDFANTFNLSEKYLNSGILATSLHMKAGLFQELRKSKKRQVIEIVENSGFSLSFWTLVNADRKADIYAEVLAFSV